KKSRQVEIKEVKFRPVTDEGDYQIKLRKMRGFLEDGDKIKVNIRFRGREMSHQELGREMAQRIEADLGEDIVVESRPRLEGRKMGMRIEPKRNWAYKGRTGLRRGFCLTQDPPLIPSGSMAYPPARAGRKAWLRPPPRPVRDFARTHRCPRSRPIGRRPSASGRPLPASTSAATPTRATSSPRRRPSGSATCGRRTTFVPRTRAAWTACFPISEEG